MNILRLSTLSLGIVFAVFALGFANPAFADKPDCLNDPSHHGCTDDGGDPPLCEDTFPGFLYQVKGTRKLPAELRLASTKGCRTEQITTSPYLRLSTFHMTADGSEGVIVWSEEPGGNRNKIVWRLDITVDGSGKLEFGEPVMILPLAGAEVPDGDTLGFGTLDVWGDATHELLFLTANRRYGFASGAVTKEVLIYDLNALKDVNASPGIREIYYEDVVDWGGYTNWQGVDEPDCNSESVDDPVPFPRFVPSCYRPENWRFNASGTRIYFSSKLFLMDGRREFAEMRLNIDWNESSYPGDWDITGPEMVYVNGPGNALPRPQSDPLQPPTEDSPEIVMADDQFLDADKCAVEYAEYSGGDEDPQTTIWMDKCLEFVLFTNSDTRSRAWESSDSYLFYRNAKGRRVEIYRFYVSGSLEGREEKLIENGWFPDSGF
jgi:hypothetical protein